MLPIKTAGKRLCILTNIANPVTAILKLWTKFQKLPASSKYKIFLTLVLLISLLAHCINFLHFPYFENDEGLYFSQAYSVYKEGKLSPYTYWYDHAPLGWIFMSIWIFLTGGPFTFGFSLFSARIFMALVHLASTYLIFRISQQYSRNPVSPFIATLLFSLSPLAIYFQRRVLIDNLMIFWILLAIFIIVKKDMLIMKRVLVSAFAFSFAILTKETGVFFLPAFILLILRKTENNLRKFYLGIWLVIVASICAYYLLFAMLKGELMPQGFLSSDNKARVSLMQTLFFQFNRGFESGIRISSNNDFFRNAYLWLKQDIVLTGLGVASIFILTILSLVRKKWKKYRTIALAGFAYFLFLIRGGLVLEFYIIPLIPFLCLSLTFVWDQSLEFIKKNENRWIGKIPYLFYSTLALYYLFFGGQSRAFPQTETKVNLYVSDQTTPQIEAVSWIKEKLKSDDFLVIDNYAYLDLNYDMSGKLNRQAHPSWKVEYDDDVRKKILNNDASLIGYIALTPQMNADIRNGSLPFIGSAYAKSNFVKAFDQDGWSVNIYAYRSPQFVLTRSWQFYKDKFIIDGRVIDPYQNNLTTSEGQSYALLRAVWIDDRETFEQVWNWTKSTLYQSQTGLFSWRWRENGTNYDLGTAPDADTDIALALILANKKWQKDEYKYYVDKILTGIWQNEVKKINMEPYLLAGNWAIDKPVLVINPSYFAPYAYKMFSEIDPDHDWNALVDNSYKVLQNCITAPLNKSSSANLPPNWCATDYDGNYVYWNEPGIDSTDYSFDALRTMWRLALDYKWFGDQRAYDLLMLSNKHLENEWNKNNKWFLTYDHSGQASSEFESTMVYAINLSNLVVTNPELAKEIYNKKIIPYFYEDFEKNEHYWEDPGNYYTQNWVWFGTALYADLLK